MTSDLAQDPIKSFKNISESIGLDRIFNSQKKTSEKHRTTVENSIHPVKLHSARIPTKIYSHVHAKHLNLNGENQFNKVKHINSWVRVPVERRRSTMEAVHQYLVFLASLAAPKAQRTGISEDSCIRVEGKRMLVYILSQKHA